MLKKLKNKRIESVIERLVNTGKYGCKNKVVVRIDDGYLIATEAQDPDYPGIDIEFVADSENGEHFSRPRVLFEKPAEDGELRVLVWTDRNSEDYSEEITFE